MNFEALIRPHLLALKPYSSARDEYSGTEGIFLDANENPFESVTGEAHNRYPDPYQWEIKKKLATIKKVKPENIFLGNGSDEPIDLIIKATCEPKENNILILPPTYGMYKVCADIQQVDVIEVPLTTEFQIDMDGVFDTVNTATRIIWLCSPNNPSGNLLNNSDIIQILKSFPEKLVVVDEAYIDFAETSSFIDNLDQFPNLIVLQTFSKAWGMAGLRLGVAYCHPFLIKILNKIKYPYNLNILTQQKLLEALDNENVKNDFVKVIIKNREELENKLIGFSFVKKIVKSDSNMLLVKFEKAKELFEYLLAQKIIIRDRTNVILCEDSLRITIGNQEDNQKLIEEIERYYSKKAS
ncbi:MAG: histidinol-phosphate transaminase [Cytophagaceae bacterium]|nr:histidinol-phosphate transaminase [Cytophagaceae bacterium]